MELIDMIIAIGLTSAAFTAGFFARGLFAEESQEQAAALERVSSRYEPPRRSERL